MRDIVFMSTASNTPLIYIQCDVPEGMTLGEWRRQRHASSRPSRLTALRHRLWF
jgi:hypothetical protein